MHSVGAAKDSASSFNIAIDAGGALITPTTADELSGWLHFNLPTSSTGTTNLSNVKINFSSQSATVEAVTIYQNTEEIFNEDNLGKTAGFTLPIAPGQVTISGPTVVSIKVQFDSLASTISVRSVSFGF